MHTLSEAKIITTKKESNMRTKLYETQKAPSTIDEIIVEQQDFINRQYLALVLLEAYRGNPKSFPLLFNEKIRKDYNYDDSNPEYIWEFVNEIADAIDIADGEFCDFTLLPNGLFSALVYAGKKKKKITLDDAIQHFGQYTGKWEI